MNTTEDTALITVTRSFFGLTYLATAPGGVLGWSSSSGVEAATKAAAKYLGVDPDKVCLTKASPGVFKATALSVSTDAWEAGYVAFETQQAFGNNPHPPCSVAHLSWNDGWREARRLYLGGDTDEGGAS